MTSVTAIKKILITAGTHGNEMSGIEYVKNLQTNNAILSALLPASIDIDVEFALVNKLAIERRTRYIQEDLNRQFSQEKLSVLSGDNLEHQLAVEFNMAFGPKHEPTRDLIIDIHNTTSNMGPTLIILQSDDFHLQMARYVKQHMPEAIILIEDHIPYQEHAYLCTVGKKGLMIEVGPQPHGVLRPIAYLQTELMTKLIVSFCDLWNKGLINSEQKVLAFRLSEEVPFPLNSNNNKNAMIHPDLQNEDFQPLKKGMPVFLTFEGETINWGGEDDVYPHFIGEAAYYHLDIAFALARKVWL
jgi:aspartoacylase